MAYAHIAGRISERSSSCATTNTKEKSYIYLYVIVALGVNRMANDRGIEIRKKDSRIVISNEGIEIQRKGKPISNESIGFGVVYLVIDCSGSMAGDKMNQAKRGALDFAKGALRKGYSTGLIRFDTIANHLCIPKNDTLDLERNIENLQIGGSTNMTLAIKMAHNWLQDKRGSRVIVIVTDGMPDNEDHSLEAGKRAIDEGIDIIAIGTDDANRTFLKKLASREELGVKVAREDFGRGIASSVNLLPSGNKHKETS